MNRADGLSETDSLLPVKSSPADRVSVSATGGRISLNPAGVVFPSSLLSVCCLAASVLTEPQRSFHGIPGPGLRPQAGGKKHRQVWKDPQSRSLWCEPKDNQKTSTSPSEDMKGCKVWPLTWLPGQPHSFQTSSCL